MIRIWIGMYSWCFAGWLLVNFVGFCCCLPCAQFQKPETTVSPGRPLASASGCWRDSGQTRRRPNLFPIRTPDSPRNHSLAPRRPRITPPPGPGIRMNDACLSLIESQPCLTTYLVGCDASDRVAHRGVIPASEPQLRSHYCTPWPSHSSRRPGSGALILPLLSDRPPSKLSCSVFSLRTLGLLPMGSSTSRARSPFGRRISPSRTVVRN